MDATEALKTKLDVREFSPKPVPAAVKTAVLEAARLTQSGTNSQHWRFILVQDPKNIETMANDSTWGKWVTGANYAVIVCTDPSRSYQMIDAGGRTFVPFHEFLEGGGSNAREATPTNQLIN